MSSQSNRPTGRNGAATALTAVALLLCTATAVSAASKYDLTFGSLGEKVADYLTPYKPNYSILGFKLLDKDPVLETSRKLGFRVEEYELDPYPLRMAAIIGVRMLSFIVSSSVILYTLYHKTDHHNSPVIKYGIIGGTIAAFLAWPLVTGMSGVMLLDFWRPALGFRSAMLVWDIFKIRTREEVEGWNFCRFLAHLWAFPREEEEIAEREANEGFKRDARIENLKGMPKVAIEFFLMFGLLYFIPPYELTVNMRRLQYHLYCDVLGLDILMCLAFFGDGLLKILGIVLNVEMADMFENPLGTTNIRLFWSHWNRAIATVLHRVVFGGGKSKAKSLKRPTAVKLKGGARTNDLKNGRAHLDHLSETETEHSKTDDEVDAKSRRSGLKPMTPSNGKSNGAAKGASGAHGKSRSPFMPKAIAAIATFAMSGIFHEHITYFTLGFANGENFLFFLAHGFATVFSTWFKRTYPSLNEKIPTWLSLLMLHAFILAVMPLFCSPFIRSGFFVQMEALKYEILPIAPRPRGSFVYLAGE